MPPVAGVAAGLGGACCGTAKYGRTRAKVEMLPPGVELGLGDGTTRTFRSGELDG